MILGSTIGELALGGFQVNDAIYLDTGAFVVTGEDASLYTTIYRAVVADAATFTFTGNAAALRLSIRANVGAFAVTGSSVALRLKMSGAAAAYTFTGQPARLALSMRGQPAAFTLTGQAGALRGARVLIASPDLAASAVEWLLGGAPLGSAPLGGDAGGAVGVTTTFALTAGNVGLQKAITLVASGASYTLTTLDNTLDYGGRTNIRAFPRVSRPNRTFARGGQPIAAKASGGGFRARAYGG